VFGLTAIKGLGRGAAAEIVRAREAGGPFRNLFEFCERVDLRIVKEGQIEKLIKAGAMDCFGPNQRAAMFKVLPQAVSGAEGKAADRKKGQKNIFDVFDGEDAPEGTDRFGFGGPSLTDTAEWPELEKLKYEKEVLDFYISSHPLAQFDEQLRRYRSHDAVQTFKMDSGAEVRLAGMVIEIVPKLVSKGRNAGNRWAIVRVEDFTGSVKCIFWSDQYARFKDELKADAILLFDGKVEWREGSTEPDVIVEKVTTMEQARKDFTKGLILRIDYESDGDGREKFEALGRTLKKSPGPCPVYLTVRDPVGRAAQFKLSHDHFVDPVAVRVEELEMLLGPGKVLFSGR
jgi:DNA polymerase III subunit alpha